MTERHHYISQFFIKGFVNERNKLYVFDKFEGQFKQNEFSSKQIFYEWNRNTIEVNGEKDDFIEKRYSSIEAKISPAYNKIKNQSGLVSYTATDIFNLLLLVSLTYWRLPINDEETEKFILDSTGKDLFIKIYNKNTNEEAPDEIYDKVKRTKGFVEMYKLSKPIFDFMALDLNDNIDNWRIGSASTVKLHILGDNPVVFKNSPGKNILENELIFPLTNGITLFHSKGKRLAQIEPEVRVMIDIIVFLQSNRYVVGPNKDYLSAIQTKSLVYDSEAKIAWLKNEIFKVFE